MRLKASNKDIYTNDIFQSSDCVEQLDNFVFPVKKNNKRKIYSRES